MYHSINFAKKVGMGKTVYLVSGYEISEDGMLSLLYEPSFNKYVSIAKSGLASALKEYYAAPTNSDKVLILKSILENITFVELKRFSHGGRRLFAMCQSENDLPSSDEFPGNLGLARKLMINGYDVYMLGNPNGIRSADFIATRKNMIYYLEGKTFNGTNTLDHLLFKAVCQAEKVVVDIITQTDVKYLTSIIRLAFERNSTLNEVMFFKGSRMIYVDRRRLRKKNFEMDFKNDWLGLKK